MDDNYKLNLKFWEDAWSRVKNPYRKLADLDYIPEIPRAFQEHQCKSILDIACGSGWLAFYLASFGFEVSAVDISASAIALAKRWIEEDAVDESPLAEATIRASSRVSFFLADMMNLDPIAGDLPYSAFDGLLINAAFEHLDYSRGRIFLEHMSKFIKPNGLMFGVFDKVATGAQGDYIELADGTKQYTDKFREGMFLRYYSDDELRQLLSETNWQVIDWRENASASRIVLALNQKQSS